MPLLIALASIVLPSVSLMEFQKVTFGNRVSADIISHGEVMPNGEREANSI